MGWLANGDPHGCTIKVVGLNESFRSWSDGQRIPLRLISQERLIISPPPVQTKYVELPGKNGKLDMTEVLTGFPIYGNRTGTLNFIVDNTNPAGNTAYDHKTWADRYEDVLSIIHGQQVELTLDDDPNYTYKGRMSVDGWTRGSSWSQLALSYDFEPYKYDNTGRYKVTIENFTDENSVDKMNVTVEKGSTTVHTESGITTAFDLNQYLDVMPVIPESKINKTDSSETTIALVNNRLKFNKTVTIAASGATDNYYGLQSFVMCSQRYVGGTTQNKCSVQTSGASANLRLFWTNGRL